MQNLFRIERMCLKFVGFRFEIKNKNSYRFFCASTLIVLSGLCYGLLNHTIHNRNNLEAAMSSLSLSLTGSMAVLKVTILIVKRQKFMEIMDFFENSFENEQQQEIKGYLKKTRKYNDIFLRSYLYMGLLTLLVYQAMPLAQWIYYFHYTNIEYSVQLPAPIRFYGEEMSTSYFVLAYLSTAVTMYLNVMYLISIDGFFLSFALNLRCSFHSLTKKLTEDDFCASGKCLENHLASYMKQHNCLLDMCELINSIYKPMIFFHFILTSIQMCAVLYQLVYGEPALEEALKNYFYLCASLMQLFVYCFSGEIVKTESTLVNEAAQISKWYSLAPKYRYFIQLLMLRSQRAFAMRSGIYEANLKNFKMLIEASVSYLMLLLSLE